MSLNLEYLLTGTPTRLRHVNRWSTSRVHCPENVAEHSYFVCLYSMLIAKSLGWKDEDLGLVLQRAVVHDLEESRTGDMHRPFKHSTPEVKKAMDLAGAIAILQVIDPISPNSVLKDELIFFWQKSKDTSQAGKVVRFADYLCVLSYILQEGPDVVQTLCLETLPEHSKEFDHEGYDFMRGLVDSAKEVMTKIFHGGIF